MGPTGGLGFDLPARFFRSLRQALPRALKSSCFIVYFGCFIGVKGGIMERPTGKFVADRWIVTWFTIFTISAMMEPILTTLIG